MLYIYAYYRLYEIRSHFGSSLHIMKPTPMSSAHVDNSDDDSAHVDNSDDDSTDGPTLDYSIRKNKGGGPQA